MALGTFGSFKTEAPNQKDFHRLVLFILDLGGVDEGNLDMIDSFFSFALGKELIGKLHLRIIASDVEIYFLRGQRLGIDSKRRQRLSQFASLLDTAESIHDIPPTWHLVNNGRIDRRDDKLNTLAVHKVAGAVNITSNHFLKGCKLGKGDTVHPLVIDFLMNEWCNHKVATLLFNGKIDLKFIILMDRD